MIVTFIYLALICIVSANGGGVFRLPSIWKFCPKSKSNDNSRPISANPYALALQPVPLNKPHFQGWLIRSVDPIQRVSLLVIIGMYSPPGSRSISQNYIYVALDSADGTVHAHEVFTEGDVTVIDNKAEVLNVTWVSNKFGFLNLMDNSSSFDLSIGKLRVACNITDRRAWDSDDPYRGGPEGWLGRTGLLPCRYFVHSTGSPTEYTATVLKDNGTITRYSGSSSSHIEGNSGIFFPTGWIWSQGIGKNGESLLVVGGLFPVGVFQVPSWIIHIRDGESVYTFRTTDFDKIIYDSDPSTGSLLLNTANRQIKVKIAILAGRPSSDFESPDLYCPTAVGFQNTETGCRETYKAVAKISIIPRISKYADGEEKVLTIPLTALEFGGAYQRRGFFNAPNRTSAA